jgi:hypothetical protein
LHTLERCETKKLLWALRHALRQAAELFAIAKRLDVTYLVKPDLFKQVAIVSNKPLINQDHVRIAQAVGPQVRRKLVSFHAGVARDAAAGA